MASIVKEILIKFKANHTFGNIFVCYLPLYLFDLDNLDNFRNVKSGVLLVVGVKVQQVIQAKSNYNVF